MVSSPPGEESKSLVIIDGGGSICMCVYSIATSIFKGSEPKKSIFKHRGLEKIKAFGGSP